MATKKEHFDRVKKRRAEKVEATRKLYVDEGVKSRREIGRRLGISAQSVSGYLQELGLIPNNRQVRRGYVEVPKVMRDDIIYLKREGLTVREIARIWKVDKAKIYRILASVDVTAR